MEQRMSQQQETFARMQESNFFFLSNLTTRRDGEAVQQERSRILNDCLKETTMVSQSSFNETFSVVQCRAVQPTHQNNNVIFADCQGI